MVSPWEGKETEWIHRRDVKGWCEEVADWIIQSKGRESCFKNRSIGEGNQSFFEINGEKAGKIADAVDTVEAVDAEARVVEEREEKSPQLFW